MVWRSPERQSLAGATGGSRVRFGNRLGPSDMESGCPEMPSVSAAYAAAAAASGLALSPIRWQIANTRSARFIV